MKTNIIERVFKFEIKKVEYTREDPCPTWNNEKVLEHFAQEFPELTNSNIVDKGIKSDVLEIKFDLTVGTKA